MCRRTGAGTASSSANTAPTPPPAKSTSTSAANNLCRKKPRVFVDGRDQSCSIGGMAYSISFLPRFIFVAGAFALGQAAAQAEVKLPSVFDDHMVLQQGQKLPIWGWADPGESVTVSVAGQTKKTKAGKDGACLLYPSDAVDAPLRVSLGRPPLHKQTIANTRLVSTR